MRYTPEILGGIHAVLFEIIEEMQRVCRIIDVNFFAIGGTAIGVHFWQNILPWDDDVDFGMLRADYDRFVREAPALLGEEFELQEFSTEPNTPFYWAKVRKRNTLFLEQGVEWCDMCHGFFVDLFPFDRVPNKPLVRGLHRAVSAWWVSAFSLYAWWEHRKELPREGSLWTKKSLPSRLLLGMIYRLRSREWLYGKMNRLLTRYNHRQDCRWVDVVRLGIDLAEYSSASQPKDAPFGRLTIKVPADLDGYLHHHYPVLRKDIPDEQKVNHAPLKLSFDTKNGPTYE